MSGLTLTGGLSVSGGGAIYNMGNLTLDAVDVVGNSTNNGGGGVFVHAGGTLTVLNSTFHDNHATDVGTSYGGAIGGHFLVGQTLTIRNSTFSNNTAATGGAVKIQATSLAAPMIARIENSTFSGNSAGTGGAFNIGRAAGSLTDIQFINTTIAHNTATAGVAGGIFKTAGDITLTLHNSILAKNTASNTTYHDLNGNLVGGGSSYNIIGQVGNSGLTDGVNGNQVGTSTVFKDPLLAPLDHYGGSRKTHALLNLSPAIDKANDLLAGASDQRGHSRAHDMPAPNGLGGSSDIGAFEADDSLTLVVNNVIDRNSLTATSDDLTLREALGKSRDLAGTERIEFDEELAGATILLSASLNELRIESDVEIAGLGTGRTTIKSGGTHRVIAVDPGVEATFSAFTVTGGGGVTEGGGIHNKGRLTLNEVAVAGNQAIWSGSASSFGGGIFTANASGRDDAALRLVNTSIDGNRATNAGGLSASIGDGGFLEIFGSTISNNIALNQTSAGAGGGMTVSGTANAPITISNSTISGNSSFHSGGIRVEGATSHVSIVQSTIYNNRANISGGIAGGLHNVSVATVVVHNSIVAGNQANNSEHRDVWGNIAGTLGDPSSNNILGMQQSTHLIAEARHSGLVDGVNGNQVGSQAALKNANLTALLDFGGPTKTHALLPTSPAVDAGNEDKALELDQRGFARYDHPGILASVADIGAFEYRPEFVVTTLEDANIPAGKLSLRQALLLAANNSQAETITFAPELFEAGPRTITLAYDGSDAGSEPDALKLHIIADSTHLLGPGANLLTVSGAGKTGVFSGSGQAIIEGITFADGKSAYSGGAISFVGDLTLRKSRITGNEGYYYGGGIDSYGWLHIEDSEISDNTVTVSSGGRGGGIFHRNGYVKTGNNAFTVSNSTISGNQVLGTSGMGGGVYVYRLNAYYGTDTLRNVTISKNSAAIGGGVTSSVSYGYGANNFIRAENSIIAGNTTLSPTTPSNVGPLTFAAGSVNNLIGYNGGTGGLTHNVNGNKILGSGESDGLQSLDFYGGSTRTHALAPNSPAVDAGNDLLASPLDQRGSTRTDVAGIGGSVTDIGAFEYQSELIVNSMADGPVGYGELTLRNALLLAERSPGPDAIRFAPEVSGTILLTQGALYINSDVTIIGPGAYELAVDAQSKSNVFVIGDDVDVELRGLTITGGYSASYGGGIYSGGLFNDGSLTLDGCVIEGNYAHSGGGLFQIDGSLTVRNSTFADNHATGFGGGVAIANLDAATFVNTTISANAAGTYGGGLYSFGSLSTRVVNSTIAFNSAATGGGIYNTVAGMIVHNTIVANNAAADPNFLDVWGSIAGTVSESSSHNIIGQAGGSGLTHSPSTTGNQVGVAPEDLKLSPLGDYGGPTPIHALLPGSLAIDGGGNGAAGSHNADQRGFERIEDGDFDGVLTVDVGAYEFSYRPSLIVDTLIDENGGTSKLSLREAIHRAAPGDVIGFADELDGGTIQLTDLGDLVIRNSVVITAQTLPNGLTIKAYDPTPSYIVDGGHDAPNGDGSRIFDIEASADGVILAGMRLTGADVLAHGGAIRSVGASLWLRNVDVYGNSTSRKGYAEYYYENEILKHRWIANTKGGGVYSTGNLYVYDSWFDHNVSAGADQLIAYETDGNFGAGEAYADDIYSTGNLYVYRTRFGGDAYFTRPGDLSNNQLHGGVLAVNGRGPEGVEIVFDDVTMTDAKGIEIDGISGGRVDDGQENVVARISNSRFENNVGLRGRYRGLYDSDIAFDDHSVGSPYGAVVVFGATLLVDDSKFSYSGQAISAVKSILEIDGSEFFENEGVVKVQDSELLIEDSVIRDNGGEESVVLRAEHGSDVKFVRTTIRNNSSLIGVDGPSSTDGGIISFMSLTPQYGVGSLVIEDSLITGNRFAQGEGDGRGTYGPAIGVQIGDRADVTYKARVLIANTTISNNVNVEQDFSIGFPFQAVRVVRSPGAIGLRGGIDAEIRGSTIAGNYTLGSGGAIGIFGGVHLLLENSTLSGNYARTFGGAIYATSTYDITAFDNVPDPDHPPFRHFRLDVVNTTITNNTAGWQGGGIYADASNNIRKFPEWYETEFNENPTVVRLLNTLISDNEALGTPNYSYLSEREVLYPFGGLAPDSSGINEDSGQTDDVWFGATTTLSEDSYYNVIGVAPIYYGPLGPLYLPIADASGLPVHGNKFGYKGAPLETRLGPLTNNGGATATHALLLPGSSTPGSPAIDAGGYLVVPVIETTSPEWNLFDPSSLKRGSQQLTRDPLSADILDDLTNDGNAWETSSVGAGLDYFATNGPVVLTFELNRDYLINELVIWSHESAESDAKSLTLEFSTDGGQSFGSPVHLTHTHNALHEPERLSLGGARAANVVRVTITDNHRVSGTTGGDQVGLGALRFVGLPRYDQRDALLSREIDGTDDAVVMPRVDVGSYESPDPATIPTTLVVDPAMANVQALVVNTTSDVVDNNYGAGQLSLREAILIANSRPGHDNITFHSSLANATIYLTNGELQITDDLKLWSTAGSRVTIDASGSISIPGANRLFGSRVLNVDDGNDDVPSSIVIIENLIITGGDVSGHGGGIRSTENLTLKNSIVVGNKVHDRPEHGLSYLEHDTGFVALDASGGGIYATGTLVLQSTIVSNNSSDFYGGGISIAGNAIATITDSTISGNVAVYRKDGYGDVAQYLQQGGGGGIFADDAALTLNRTTISGNSAFHGGGALVMESAGTASITAANATVSGNRAEHFGGGLAVISGANLTLEHSTVTANTVRAYDRSSSLGGGLMNQGGAGVFFDGGYDADDGVVVVSHSIIAQNYGYSHIRDIYNGDDSPVYDPISDSDLIIETYAAASQVRYSLLGDGYGSRLTNDANPRNGTGPFTTTLNDGNLSGIGNYYGGGYTLAGAVRPALDAQLDVLANNGGLTWTHALKVGSPAINKGTATLSVDQRGFTRAGTIDLGAFESEAKAAGTPPMSLQMLNTVTSLPEDVNVAASVRVADLSVLHGHHLTYAFTLSGADASLFEVVGRELRLKTTAIIDFETNPVLNVSVSAADLTSPVRTAGPVHLAISLLDRNDAPSLDVGAFAQIPLSRDVSVENNVGVLASELIGNVVDQDANSLKGLVIVGVDATVTQYGRFEYTVNGGATWRDVGFVSEEAALPLTSDALTRIRFVPHDTFQGTLTNALRFRAWDRTSGIARQKASLNSLGSSVSGAVVNGGIVAVTSSSASHQRTPSTAVDAVGGSFVVWEANGDVFGQRYNASGVATTSVLTIAADSVTNYAEPNVAIAADGSVIVVWRSDEELFGKRLVIDAAGAVQSTSFSVEVSSDTTTDPSQPRVAANRQGKFIVAWRESWDDGSLVNAPRLYVREYTITETGNIVETLQNGVSYMAAFSSPPLDLSIPNYTPNPSLPVAASDSFNSLELADDGTFVAAWDRADLDRGYGRDAYVGRFRFERTGNGSEYFHVVGDTQLLQGTSNGDQRYSAAVSFGESYYVAWADFVDRSIHLRRYGLVDGVVASAEETVVYSYGDPTNSIHDYDAAKLTPASPTPASWVNWVNGLDLAIDAAGRIGIAWSTSDDANLSGDASMVRVEWRSYDEHTGLWTDHGSYENAGDWHSLSLNSNDGGDFQLTALKPVTAASITRDEVFTQRFASDVTATVAVSPRVGDPIVVNGDGAHRTGSQSNPRVAIDVAGNAIHVWYGSGPGGTGIYARRFDAGGNPMGGSFLVTATSSPVEPNVAVDDSGNVLIVWRRMIDGTFRVYGAKYALQGQVLVPLWGATGKRLTLGTGAEATTGDYTPAVAFADDGSFMLTWIGTTTAEEDNVYAKKFAADGLAISGVDAIKLHGLSTAADHQVLLGSRSIAFANGEFHVAFVDHASGNPRIYLRAISESGTTLGELNLIGENDGIVSDLPPGAIDIADKAILSLSVAASPNGQVAVAWLDYRYVEILTNDGGALAIATYQSLLRKSNDVSWTGDPHTITTARSTYDMDSGLQVPGSETIIGASLAYDDAGRLGVAWSRITGSGPPVYSLASKWFATDEEGAEVVSGPFYQTTSTFWGSPQLAGGPNGAYQLTSSSSVATYGNDILMQRFSWGSEDASQPELEENGALHIDARDSEGETMSVEVRGYGGLDYIWINGQLTSILASDVKELSITGGDGADVIDLRKLAPGSLPSLGLGGIVVRGGDGDDTIYIGTGTVRIDGGAGDDAYVISNKRASDVTIVDAAGDDSIEFADWQVGSAGALIALGYAGTQTVTRGPLSEVVKLTLVTGNEIDSVTGGSQHVVFNRHQKPPSLIVNTTTDELNLTNGNLSLREALMWAKLDAAADKITFSLPANSTIRLANLDGSVDNLPDQLIIDSAVEIDGAGAPGLAVSGETLGGSYRSRVFYVTTAGAATLRNFTITHGSATGADDDGGGVLANGTLVLDRMTVSGNSAAGSGGGVAVMGTGAYLQMIDSTITANNAPYGAGVNVESANAQVTGSVIYANGSALAPAAQGGGLRQYGVSTIDITNSTISGNYATNGGGLYTNGNGNLLKLTNVTAAFNWGNTGGGIYGDTTSILARNTIVAKNTQLNGTAHDVSGPSPSTVFVTGSTGSTRNLIGHAGSAGGLTAVLDNIIGPNHAILNSTLALNGGSTTLNHALDSGAGNPAVNAPNATSTVAPPVDQRGYVPGGTDTVRDIGATEYNGDLDTAPPLLPNLGVAVKENLTNGDVVATAAAGPNWRRFTYTIISGNHSGAFEIDANTGVITVADASLFDAERFPSYLLQVKATQISGGTGTDVGLVRINLESVNEAPWVGSGLRTNVSEGVYNGATIGFVVGIDPDQDALTYTKRSTTGGSAALEVDSKTGAIRVVDASRLKGLGSFELEVEVRDPSGLKSTARVLIEVTPSGVAPTPEVTPIESADYEVSHRKELSFNPIAGFDNLQGRDFRVEFYGSGSSAKLKVNYVNGKPAAVVDGGKGDFNLGVLSLNPDGSFKFKPKDNLVKDNKLTVDEGHRFTATDSISYKIVTVDNSSKLGEGSFTVKVKNDLPVHRQDFRTSYKEPVVLALGLNVRMSTTYRLDVDDFFFDPDGDALEIKQIKNLAPINVGNYNGGYNAANEVASGETSLTAVVAYKHHTEFVKELTIEKTSASGVEISHDAVLNDLVNLGYSNSGPISQLRNFELTVSDGQQKSDKQFAATRFQFDVFPKIDVSGQGELNPQIDIVKAVPSQPQKIDSGKWSVDAVSRRASREGRDLEAVGDALVDLNSGALIRRHELILDGSGGAAELSLPGLIYDSATVDPRPVIQAALKRQEDVWPKEIVATFRWIDHANGDASGPRELPPIVKTYALPQSVKDLNDPSIKSLNDVKEFMFSFQPAEAPLFTGVYSWEVEFKITVEHGAAGPAGDEILTLTQHGETPVVVQRKVTEANFKGSDGTFDQSPGWWNYTPAFGNGWALEGVPQLFVDDQFDGPDFDNNLANDRLIVHFPGQAPRLFQPGEGATGGSDRYDYGDGVFDPVNVSTSLADRTEWGRLKSLFDGGIVYTDPSGVEYAFEKTLVAANASDPNSMTVSAWRIRTIKAPGVMHPIEFVYASTSGATSLRMTKIIGSDHDGTPSGKAKATTEIVYTGDFVNKLTLPDGEVVEFAIGSSTYGLDEIEHINPQISSTIVAEVDRVRHFTYDSVGRMTTDKWFNNAYTTSTTSSDFRRSTTFGYDANGLLNAVTVGINDAPNGEAATVYSIVSVAAEGLSTTSVINPKRIATVKTATDLRSLTESTGAEKVNGGDWITNYTFDDRGHVTQREEQFKPTSGSATQLSVQRWTYDHLGSVKSFEDAHLREPRQSGETAAAYGARIAKLLGRMTYYSYDYETPINSNFISDDGEYLDDKATFSSGEHFVPVAQYDKDDYRGNLTQIVAYAGVETFQYETRDAAEAALGKLVKHVDVRGVVTRYRYNENGQTLEVRTIRGKDDAVDANDATKDYVEKWTYYVSPSPWEGLVETYVSPLGLQTTYQYFDESRRLKQTTVVDDGLNPSSSSDDETIVTVYDYNGSDAGYGFVESVTTYRDAVSSGNVLSVANFVYDATGLLRQVSIASTTGAELSSNEFDYDPNGVQTVVVDGRDFTTRNIYDKRGLLKSTTEAQDAQYASHYLGNVNIEQETKFEYYKDGSLKERKLPDGTKVKQFADPLARKEWNVTTGVATTTSFVGGEPSTVFKDMAVSSEYDVQGRLITEKNLLTGAHSRYFYGDARHDQPTRIAERANLGRAATNEEFSINNIDDANLADDLATILAYDRAGNAVFEQQSGQAGRAYVFDELGYLKASKTLTSLGAEISYKTDPLGNVLEQKEVRKQAGAANVDVVTSLAYDEQGRLRRVTDAELGVTEYDYAFEQLDPSNLYNNPSIFGDEVPNDLVRTVTSKVVNGPNANDDLITKQYVDATGQAVRELSPLGATTLRVHDKAGIVTHEIFHPAAGDAGMTSRIVEHKYDGLNRLRETIQHGTSIDATKISSFVDYFLPDDIGSYDWDVITTAPDGAATRFDFDSLGKSIATQQDDPGVDYSMDDAPLTLHSYTYLASKLAYAVTSRITSARGQADLNESTRLHDETRVSRQVFNAHGDLLVASEWTSGTLASDALSDSGDFIDAGFQIRQSNRYAAPGQLFVSADGEWKKTTYNYDMAKTGVGQVSQIASPNGEKTLYDYDSAGNRLAMRQVRGDYDKTLQLEVTPGDLPDNITIWTYDKLGRMTSEVIDVDIENLAGNDTRGTETRTWAYSGLTTTYTDRDDRVSTKEFDLATRTSIETVDYGGGASYSLTTILHSDGSLKRTEDAWNGIIAGTSRTFDSSVIDFTYDQYGRQLTTTETFDFDGSTPLTSKLTNVYDNVGRIFTGTWALNSTDVLTNTYRYDGLSRVDGVSQDVNAAASALWFGGATGVGRDKSVSAVYNANGSREQVSRYIAANYGTEVSDTDYKYANDGSITDLVHRRLDDNVVIASYSNVRDASGRAQSGGRVLKASAGVSPETLKDERVNYHYDDKGQLTATSPINSSDLNDLKPINSDAYNYDDVGNRINPLSDVTRQNRLRSDGHYAYEYDGEGRLTKQTDSKTGHYHNYAWDHRGRLLAVEYRLMGGSLDYRVDYGYDALGRQVAKKLDSTSGTDEFVGYVSDGSRPVFEVNLAAGANVNKIASSYFYGPGGDVAAVDQAGKTIWNFADASGTVATVGYADPAGDHHWKLLHRNYDQFGQKQKFSMGDSQGTLKDFLGDEADTALLNAPEFFAGQAWDEGAKLYDFGNRWYDPFSGRYTADGGGSNGYRFMENGPTRDRFVSSGLSDVDLDSIYGDSWWNGLQRSVGETVRWGVGDKALAGASNTSLYLGVGVTSVAAAVGIVYAAPFLASGAQAAGAWAGGSIAAGAQAAGATIGVYLGKQAALSAVQTGVETTAAWGLGGDVSFSGVLGSFAVNFGVNSVTGGTGVFARQGIEIAAGTAYDVARGESFGSSLAFNAVGVVGGEAAFKTLGRAYSSQLSHQAFAYAGGFARGFSESAFPPRSIYAGSIVGGFGNLRQRLGNGFRAATVSVPRTTGGTAYKTWNQFESGTAGQFASRAEAASAWRIYKEANGIVTGTTRSPAVARQFLKSLADDYRTPSWMKQWLREGRRPPGYEIDHIKPLSIGGEDLPSNMRLQGIDLHDTHHRYYRPWEW